MNKILLIAGLVLFLISVSFIGASFIQKEYVLLEVHYIEGVFELQSKSLGRGNYPTVNHDLDNEYEINLLSEKDDLLYSNGINPGELFIDTGEGELEGGVVQIDNTVFYVIVPSVRKGDRVEIKDSDGVVVLAEDVYDVGAKSCRVK